MILFLVGLLVSILIGIRIIKLVRMLFMKEFWIGVVLQVLFVAGIMMYIVPNFMQSFHSIAYQIFLVAFSIIAWITLMNVSGSFRLPILFVFSALTLGLVVFGIGADVDADVDVDTDADIDPDFDVAFEEAALASEYMASGLEVSSGLEQMASINENFVFNSSYSSMDLPSIDVQDISLTPENFQAVEPTESKFDLHNINESEQAYPFHLIPDEAVIFDHDLNNNESLDGFENDFDQDRVPDNIDSNMDNDDLPDSIDSDLDNDQMPDSYDSDLDNDGIPDNIDRDLDNDNKPDYL